MQTFFFFFEAVGMFFLPLLRYLAIVHPLVSRAQQSKARAKRILLAVWAAPCLLASPFLQPARAESDTLWSHYGSISRRSCLITLDPSFRRRVPIDHCSPPLLTFCSSRDILCLQGNHSRTCH
ncbi:hypothetical protein HPB48_020022 [Haemaphysalis longicornis]|uniref:G-protein coupled receptors family 1 profile domain-containing protein n=1 Tax=Haemaphysalis longicornis TaxID=44386 RepID=A0A9J6GZX4_HAELO|nr:hypothetical protein HPB48_020022 [Haemaphysalis longicornis]